MCWLHNQAVFPCPECSAQPEPLTAVFAVVRHGAGCALLASVVRSRWPLSAAGLPETPSPQPFASHAADSGPFQRVAAKAAGR